MGGSAGNSGRYFFHRRFFRHHTPTPNETQNQRNHRNGPRMEQTPPEQTETDETTATAARPKPTHTTRTNRNNRYHRSGRAAETNVNQTNRNNRNRGKGRATQIVANTIQTNRSEAARTVDRPGSRAPVGIQDLRSGWRRCATPLLGARQTTRGKCDVAWGFWGILHLRGIHLPPNA